MAQLAFNVLLATVQNGLIACAFFCVLATAKHFNFLVGATYLLAPHCLLLMPDRVIHSLVGVSVAAVSLAAGALAIGILVGAGIIEPLRRRGATALQLMLVSLCLLYLAQNGVSLITSGRSLSLELGYLDPLQRGIDNALADSPLVIGATQFVTLVCGGTALMAALVVWTWSPLGILFRIAQEDSLTAATFGVDVAQVRSWAMGGAATIGALAGVLHAVDNTIHPQMGMDAAFVGMVCVIIGGHESLVRPLIGALMMALLSQGAAYFVPGNWGAAIAYSAVVTSLLARGRWTRGALGTGGVS